METTSNNDALVDCIVYANQVRMGMIPSKVEGRRQIRDLGSISSDNVCSISMCGNDDDPSVRVLKYCENGHFMHDKCIEYLFESAEHLSVVGCPQCRSRFAIDLAKKRVPIPGSIFTKLVCSDAVVDKIVAGLGGMGALILVTKIKK